MKKSDPPAKRPTKPWIVVTDFDGTLTERDVGNELCAEVLGQEFFDIHARYNHKEFGLKELQQKLWNHFPLPLAKFRERSLHHGRLRPGVVEFLRQCAAHDIPVYVASCGLRDYIEPVLEGLLDTETRRVIREIRCNEAEFDAAGIHRFIPPVTSEDCPYPLDKGEWALEIRRAYPDRKIFGIGNGTSDRSFWPRVDLLGATEKLADWCTSQKVPHIKFEDFRDLLGIELFR